MVVLKNINIILSLKKKKLLILLQLKATKGRGILLGGCPCPFSPEFLIYLMDHHHLGPIASINIIVFIVYKVAKQLFKMYYGDKHFIDVRYLVLLMFLISGVFYGWWPLIVKFII